MEEMEILSASVTNPSSYSCSGLGKGVIIASSGIAGTHCVDIDPHRSTTKIDQKAHIRSPCSTASTGGGRIYDRRLISPPKSAAISCALLLFDFQTDDCIWCRPQETASLAA